LFDYDEQWAGMADSKIFESNLEASQVPSLYEYIVTGMSKFVQL